MWRGNSYPIDRDEIFTTIGRYPTLEDGSIVTFDLVSRSSRVSDNPFSFFRSVLSAVCRRGGEQRWRDEKKKMKKEGWIGRGKRNGEMDTNLTGGCLEAIRRQVMVLGSPRAPEGNISVSNAPRFQVHSSIPSLIMLIISPQIATHGPSRKDTYAPSTIWQDMNLQFNWRWQFLKLLSVIW